jgi:hypothetical protein
MITLDETGMGQLTQTVVLVGKVMEYGGVKRIRHFKKLGRKSFKS